MSGLQGASLGALLRFMQLGSHTGTSYFFTGLIPLPKGTGALVNYLLLRFRKITTF